MQLSTAEIAFWIFAALRIRPHINNVLTHISHAKLVEVEKSLHRILDPSTTVDGLSPLEENIIELMVGERGIAGKLLNPHFQAILYGILEPDGAERLIRSIKALYLGLEWRGSTRHLQRSRTNTPRNRITLETSSSERVIDAVIVLPG